MLSTSLRLNTIFGRPWYAIRLVECFKRFSYKLIRVLKKISIFQRSFQAFDIFTAHVNL